MSLCTSPPDSSTKRNSEKPCPRRLRCLTPAKFAVFASLLDPTRTANRQYFSASCSLPTPSTHPGSPTSLEESQPRSLTNLNPSTGGDFSPTLTSLPTFHISR